MSSTACTDGWTAASVLDLSDLIRGVSYSKGEATLSPTPKHVAMLRANNITDTLSFDGLYYVPSHRVGDQQRLHMGDVVIAMSSGSKSVVGKAACLCRKWEGTFGAFCGVLRPSPAIDARFFSLYFRTKAYRHAISEASAGTNINNLKREHFSALKVPLPPLAEQRRIVAKVEELLARVNAARDRLAKLPIILARFRHSVLTAACSGELTGNVRQDELPSTWQMVRLDSLFEIRTGGTPDRKRPQYYREGTIPWVKTTEVQNCDIYDTGEKITTLALENSSAKVFPPTTLIVALYGEGKTRGQVARLMKHAATNQACCALINPTMPDVTNRYIFWCLRRDYHRLREQSAGGNQPNLSNGIIKRWEIPLPPIEEQREIVRRIDAILTAADKIESRLQLATANAAKIAQAILAKAFRGELVPTEAELARQERRDYEPASVLLNRIRAERAPTDKSPAGRRRTPRKVGLASALNGHAAPPESSASALPPARNSTNAAMRFSSRKPAQVDLNDRDEVMALIRQVFLSGAGRTRKQAIKEISAALGFGRAGSRIAESLDNDLRAAVRRGILENDADGLRLLCRTITDYTRDFLVEQLQAGMGTTWWDREDLIESTARWLGFRRTGPVIRDTLKSAINSAIRRGLLEHDARRVRKKI